MKFVSARDAMYNGVILGSIFFICVLALIVFLTPCTNADKIVSALMCLILVPFLLYVYLGTFYLVTDEFLIIHYGPFKKTLRLDRIFSIKPFRSIYTAPALSSDRLQIRYDKYGEVQVSPQDQNGFLEAMGFCPGGPMKKQAPPLRKNLPEI